MKTFFVGHSDSASQFLESTGISVQKIFFGRKPSDSLTEFARSKGIELAKLSELRPSEFDVVILFECHRIFSAQELSQGKWINIHAGLLPYWRGFHANSWAILGNFPRIGISIHEVVEDLDAGPIIKTYSIANDYFTPYLDLKQSLMAMVMEDFEMLLKNYLEGKILPQTQIVDTHEIRYCTKLKLEDGIINSFDISCRDVLNLFRIFSSSKHSDFFSNIRGKLVNVLKVEIAQEVSPGSPGSPGEILSYNENNFLVKTLDGAVWLTVGLSDLEKLAGN